MCSEAVGSTATQRFARDTVCTLCLPSMRTPPNGCVPCGSEADQRAGQMRLQTLLVRIAHAEVRRRSSHLQIVGPELDDLAYQAAADAMMKIIDKLGDFRGESRFTTWAYKFVMFEVSSKIGRHFWRRSGVSLDAAGWDGLPDRFGLDPARESEWQDLVIALRSAVDEVLTERQRLTLQDRGNHLKGVHPLERRLAGHQLIEHHTQAEDV